MSRHPNQKTEHNKKHDEQPPLKENEEKTVTLSEKEYKELKEKESEAAQNHERLLRVQADFENARRRLEKEKLEFIRFANQEIISELIPIVDDFQRALVAADKTKDFNILHKGVEMILKHLLEILKEKGVTPIEALGKTFDPLYHEAMLQEESVEYPDQTVIEELQKGYLLNNKVLRTTKVKVAKKVNETQTEPKSEPKEEKDTKA